MSDIILQLNNITKRYAGVVALKNVTVNVRRGEVMAVAGENGAGKSTLIKIISGAHEPSEGDMIFDGNKITQFTPAACSSIGVSVVYQEHNLMPHLTVSENVFFGRELKRGIILDKKAMNNHCAKLISEFGVDFSPNTKVGELSIAGQQLVEIIKAVSRDCSLLIMDEPTAPLTGREIDKMFEIVAKLKKNGVTILYISHRLEEIFEIADRVTILKDGELVATLEIAQATIPQLVKHMVGREVGQEYPLRVTPIGAPLMQVTDYHNKFLKGCSFTLHQGEILGFGGLVGAGRTELVRAVFGADPISSGDIKVRSKSVTIKKPSDAIAIGISLITEDRKAQGLLLNKEISFNIVFPNMSKVSTLGVVSSKKERATAQQYADAMDVRAYSLLQLAGTLSGGNQQKVVLAKWLATSSDIFIFDEPTRGIDVGAKAEIYQLMRKLSEEGKSIIMISSEMQELMGMCDRIMVMQDGRFTGELMREMFSQERILELAVLNVDNKKEVVVNE